jgi:hypothetical protein
MEEEPANFEKNKKIVLVGETDDAGNLFITKYNKEDRSGNVEGPKVDIKSASALVSPFPNNMPSVSSTPEEPSIIPPPPMVSSTPEEPSTIPPPPMVSSTPEQPSTIPPPPMVSSTPEQPSTIPPPKPPKPATMSPVDPLFTKEMQEGGRKYRGNKKTGKKQKGGKLRRKSRKYRK